MILQDSKQWREIVAALGHARKLGSRWRGSSLQQRAESDERLAAAKRTAAQLAADGLLSPEEADLLAEEADGLSERYHRMIPSDAHVTCYKIQYVPKARISYDRLARRLPLLQAATERGRIHGDVLQRLLPAIRADLKTLAARRKLWAMAHLGGEEDKPKAEQAERLREQVELLLARIERF